MEHAAAKAPAKPRTAATMAARPGQPAAQSLHQPREAARPPPAHCACGGTCPRCRAKSRLGVGPAGDSFEREADAVADRVMRMPAGARAPTVAAGGAGVQRKCSACESEDEKLVVRAKAAPGGAAPAVVDSVLGGPGQALDGATRRFFDSRFGYDFSAVRVHTGGAAAQSARAINALAYTAGHDIVFGAGQYAPDTDAGRHLLAHELTHVIQQSGGAVPGARLQRQEGATDDEEPEIDFGEVEPSTGVGRPPPEFGERPAEPGCPAVPTNLGDLRPDPPCPTEAVGSIVGSRFQFCMDSDAFIDQRQVDLLRDFARRQRADSLFKVHGFASTDGAAAYNLRLSCHRAKRAARELQNAGVPSQQIRIAAMGETSSFGATQAENRIVIVGADAPAGQVTPDATRRATTLREAADLAIGRIIARDYRLAADAYVSRWTCGTIPSVAEMVRRTTVLVEGENGNATIPRPPANPLDNPRLGHPNVTGLREIVLARETFSEADNPVLCAAARIIDMAFHHFLAPRLNTGPNDAAVHPAAIFLVELAGFPPCMTPAGTDPATGLVLVPAQRWWRAPTADPLASTPPPCPSRQLPGAIDPQQQGPAPPTPLTFSSVAFDATGSSTVVTPRISEPGNAVRIAAPRGAFRFRATVQAAGDAAQFPRYEVGFLQTIVADQRVASYVSGHAINEAVPVPMRDGPPAHLDGPPWFMPPVVQRLDATGRATAELSDSPSAAMPLVFTDLTRLDPSQPLSRTVQAGNDLNRATVRVTFNTWVAARRDDAPMDRFSTHFVEGRQTTFSMDLEMFGHSGEAKQRSVIDPAPLTDSTPMQVNGPTAADVNPLERITHISPPTPRGQVQGAADAAEIRRQVRSVAAELVPLRQALHLDGPLMVRVRFDPTSGRLILDTPERPATTVEETGPDDEREGVGESGRKQLGREFTLRLRKDLVAAPGVPDLSQGFPTALAALPSFAARRRRAAAQDPNPFAAEHGIGLLAQIREEQELARSDEGLRNNPNVYDPSMFPRVNVRFEEERYCFNFAVSGVDLDGPCNDPTMRTDGCVRPFTDEKFTLRTNPLFVPQQLGGETFNSPVTVNVTTFPMRFVLFTPRENPGGSTFNHEMHHMIDSRNILQAMKDRLARRIRARVMEIRRMAADNPELKEGLLTMATIEEIVRQEHQPFLDFFQREFLARGNALHARENRGALPPYRSALPPDWTTFREPPFTGGTRGSLDDGSC
ncbi:DUF4157 domain-containing protein [Massilia sp. METH4]|uniref:eCIS core domain-containing protein n=1 Tax=Massilia sp. METH4 TaxID=3123041 RepID=UPI0030CED515